MNLKDETIEYLESHRKSTNDVLWVGSQDGKMKLTWNQFIEIANFEYDDGYGHQEIDSNLVVVGDGWWFERAEYDGAEGWRINFPPSLKKNTKPFVFGHKVNSKFPFTMIVK